MESSRSHIKTEHVISFADVLLSIEVPQLPHNVTESNFIKELSNLAHSFETYAISLASLFAKQRYSWLFDNRNCQDDRKSKSVELPENGVNVILWGA